jgi:hypothetical protein
VTVEKEYPAPPPPVHHTVLVAVVWVVLPVDKIISIQISFIYIS